jgi:hypothetical protein
MPDPGGARTVPRIGQGSPRRGERVSPVSIANLLTELPDGIVRLCGRGEGTDNRTVVPLINDIDAPFFHRSASSSDKLARVQCSKFAAKSPVTANKPLKMSVVVCTLRSAASECQDGCNQQQRRSPSW